MGSRDALVARLGVAGRHLALRAAVVAATPPLAASVAIAATLVVADRAVWPGAGLVSWAGMVLVIGAALAVAASVRVLWQRRGRWTAIAAQVLDWRCGLGGLVYAAWEARPGPMADRLAAEACAMLDRSHPAPLQPPRGTTALLAACGVLALAVVAEPRGFASGPIHAPEVATLARLVVSDAGPMAMAGHQDLAERATALADRADAQADAGATVAATVAAEALALAGEVEAAAASPPGGPAGDGGEATGARPAVEAAAARRLADRLRALAGAMGAPGQGHDRSVGHGQGATAGVVGGAHAPAAPTAQTWVPGSANEPPMAMDIESVPADLRDMVRNYFTQR